MATRKRPRATTKRPARSSAAKKSATKRSTTRSASRGTSRGTARSTPRTASRTSKQAVRTTSTTPSRKTASKTAKRAEKSAAGARKTTKNATRTATKARTSENVKSNTGASLDEYQRKRDFTRTKEPAGAPEKLKTATRQGARKSARKTRPLRFVIQKHAATQLHFDLRLELDGVMKSWAVPKGPSIDPTVKRLAMQVEDHPIEYNTFEGTIPEGEYGGGTVMLWDTGTYAPDTSGLAQRGKSSEPLDIDGMSEEDIARYAYERGDFKIIFHGKRMQGSYVLVRTRGFGSRDPSKPSWLLIKHRDEYAEEAPKRDLVERYTTSVVTERTMDEISRET